MVDDRWSWIDIQNHAGDFPGVPTQFFRGAARNACRNWMMDVQIQIAHRLLFHIHRQEDVDVNEVLREFAVAILQLPPNMQRQLVATVLFTNEQRRANPPPAQRLGQIAADRQNTHTTEASEMVNQTIEFLKNRTRNNPISPALQEVLESGGGTTKHVPAVAFAFFRIFDLAISDGLKDEKKSWYAVVGVKYTDLLFLVLDYICDQADYERRKELFTRLRDEFEDSVGMCFEGHRARLCSVLVGFEDGIRSSSPPIGELLQREMGRISLLELPTEKKVATAAKWMDENKVRDHLRREWLEAF